MPHATAPEALHWQQQTHAAVLGCAGVWELLQKVLLACRHALANARATHAAELTTERQELEARAAVAASAHVAALQDARVMLKAELEAAREEHAAERTAWDTERERQGVVAGEAQTRLAESMAAAAEWRRLAQQLEADIKQQVMESRFPCVRAVNQAPNAPDIGPHRAKGTAGPGAADGRKYEAILRPVPCE